MLVRSTVEHSIEWRRVSTALTFIFVLQVAIQPKVADRHPVYVPEAECFEFFWHACIEERAFSDDRLRYVTGASRSSGGMNKVKDGFGCGWQSINTGHNNTIIGIEIGLPTRCVAIVLAQSFIL